MKIEEEELKKHADVLNICITGAMNPKVRILIQELIRMKELGEKTIVLHDSNINFFDSEEVHDLVEDAMNMIRKITVCELLRDSLPFCDLLIIIEDMSR